MSEILAKRGVTIPNPGASAVSGFSALRALGPERTPEFFRVLGLPKREVLLSPEFAADMTELFRAPGGTWAFHPRQAATIAEAAEMRGGLFGLAVGEGKTLLSLVIPVAMEAKRPLLLVPASVRAQLLGHDQRVLGEQFRLHPNLTVWSYEDLSQAKNTGALEELAPDLILADEAHRLRHKDAARTRRFLRYMVAHPECRFVGLSGTLVGKTILDYAHLSELALRDGAPLPRKREELLAWSAALDVGHASPTGPGCLAAFVEGVEQPTMEEVREGFRRRLLSTPGVVFSEAGSVGASLILSERKINVPQAVEDALEEVELKWATPGGEVELADPMALARVLRQVSAGFFYVWRWPTCQACDGHGSPAPLREICGACNGDGLLIDHEWNEARKGWAREVGRYLRRGHVPEGMDSELLLANAARRKKAPPEIQSAWEAWAPVRDRDPPPVDPVWLDAFLVKDAVRWANESPGIVWFTHEAVGDALRAEGLRVFGPGETDSKALVAFANSPEAGRSSFAASIPAHGTGKNLQKWARNLIVEPPSSGTVWEQLLGRTHRQGQEADEVVAEIYRHSVSFQGAFGAALGQERYVQQTTGALRKLVSARRLWEVE
jgi:hypothetical protein